MRALPQQPFIERYRDRLHGVFSCYDLIVVTGTLPQAFYAAGMTAFLNARGIRVFDYPRFAEPLRDAIRTRARALAESAGVEIEHIRQEDVAAKVLERRGDHPGPMHVRSAMGACSNYRPWHDKASGKTLLEPDTGKCLYYDFHFLDPHVGLCYLRAPRTLFPQAPFRATKAAVKLCTPLGLRVVIPNFIRFVDGKLHDVNAPDLLILEPAAIYVFCRHPVREIPFKQRLSQHPARLRGRHVL